MSICGERYTPLSKCNLVGLVLAESLANIVVMKKTIAIAAASIFAVVGLSACSNDKAEEPVVEEVVTEEEGTDGEEEVEEEEVVEEDGEEEAK